MKKEIREQRYKLLKDGNDMLGGALSGGNAYLRYYASYPDKRYVDLAVGESCPCTISLSGETGHYEVLRVADAIYSLSSKGSDNGGEV